MAVYTTSNAAAQSALTGTYKTQLTVIGAGVRALVQEFDVGSNATAADNVITYDVSRKDATTAGTSTGGTTVATDSTFRASSATTAYNYSAEPTTYTSLFTLALNQRASYRWVASPGSELVLPATSNFAIGLRALSNATPTVTAMMLFIE